RRIQRGDQLAQRRRRDEMFGAKLSQFARRCPSIRAFDATAAMSNPLDPDSFDCLMTASRKQAFTMLPHHSRPEARVGKWINERRDDLPIRGAPGADERVAQRFAQ